MAFSMKMKERIDLIAYVLDALVAALCVYLAFGLNESRYRWLCAYCDNCCYRICHKMVAHPTIARPLEVEASIPSSLSPRTKATKAAEAERAETEAAVTEAAETEAGQSGNEQQAGQQQAVEIIETQREREHADHTVAPSQSIDVTILK